MQQARRFRSVYLAAKRANPGQPILIERFPEQPISLAIYRAKAWKDACRADPLCAVARPSPLDTDRYTPSCVTDPELTSFLPADQMENETAAIFQRVEP